MRASVGLLAGVSVLLLAAPCALATGILVAPAQMGLVIKPGDTGTDVFRVSASRSEKTQVHVRVVDFDKSPDGDTIEPKGPPARSCVRWVRVEPIVFQTAESGWTEVRVSVTVPPDARGTHWALIIFQVDPVAGKRVEGRTVMFRPQLQVPLLVTAGGTEARGARIENFKAVLGADGLVSLTADIANTGNTGLLPTGSWVLERRPDSSGVKEELAEKELASFLLLPGHTYRAHERLASSGSLAQDLAAHVYMVYGIETGQVAEAAAPVAPEAVLPRRLRTPTPGLTPKRKDASSQP